MSDCTHCGHRDAAWGWAGCQCCAAGCTAHQPVAPRTPEPMPADDYAVALKNDPEDGTVIAWCPDLPGCMAHGDTVEQALLALVEVKRAWLELDEGRHSVPVEQRFGYEHTNAGAEKEIARMEAERDRSRLPAGEWQPMETAPKGPHVLVLYEQFGVTYWGCARWETFNDGQGAWIGSSFYATGDDRNWTTFSSPDNFRGWLPLPPVPSEGDAK